LRLAPDKRLDLRHQRRGSFPQLQSLKFLLLYETAGLASVTLGGMQLRQSGVNRIRVIDFVPVDEHDDVGVLLDCARIPQIAPLFRQKIEILCRISLCASK